MREKDVSSGGVMKHATIRMLCTFAVSAALLCPGAFAADMKPAQPAFQAAKQPDIQAVRPKRPAKVRLHRNAKGEYTWDITGDSADDVVRADARLRKLLKIE
jgi:hypothetical protein